MKLLTDQELTKLSKFLSLVLRHKPETLDLLMEAEGWTNTEQLVVKLNKAGFQVDQFILEQVVRSNDKQRFALNADKTRIRANQGHSIPINLGLPAIDPPEFLFHGTSLNSLPSIRLQGIYRMKRIHVHLSADPVTAKTVGARHGVPQILRIKAAQMAQSGNLFYLAENGVWLTDYVDPQFIEVL